MAITFESIVEELKVDQPSWSRKLELLLRMFNDQVADTLREKGRIRNLRHQLSNERAHSKAMEEIVRSAEDASDLVSQLKEHIESLERKVAKGNKTTYGQKADRKPRVAPSAEDDEQAAGEMLENQAQNSPTPSEQAQGSSLKKKKKRGTSGRGPTDYGPGVEKKTTWVATEDKLCECGCGGTIRGWDKSRTLEYIPARYIDHKRCYAKYRCRRLERIVSTKFFKKLIARTGMSPEFVAHIITMRYLWHLPWYRQSDRVFARQGFTIERSTLMRWSNRVAVELLRPIYEILCDEIMQASMRIFFDETTVRKLAPGTGKSTVSYFYAAHRDDSSFGGDLPPVVVYFARNTRAKYQIQEILKGCTAIIQHDGYAGYNCLGQKGTVFEHIEHAECWAHTRRYFTDEWEFKKTSNAAIIVELIGKLYDVERQVRGRDPDYRVRRRRVLSRPILAQINAKLIEFQPQHQQNGTMAKAIAYALRRWDGLTRFVDNGFIDLDTNPVERMMKPVILSRKNVKFIGSDEGADAWTIHSSLAETCHLNEINFEKYLIWVFEKLIAAEGKPDYASMLPWDAPISCRYKEEAEEEKAA